MPELGDASAIKHILSGKSPGSDGISVDLEVFKYGGDQLHIVLHQLLCISVVFDSNAQLVI